MDKPRIVNLPQFLDARGNLSFVEQENHIPPGGECRGGHAYKENQEFIVALSGSFDVILDDGKEKKVFTLNRSYYGLYVPKGLWREMDNFSTNSLAMILSSTYYDADDYVRDYDEFIKLKHDGKI